MKDELVTLITLTYAKAQVLKSVLESEGIMAELYNVNIIQPFVSSGVKVCINAKDIQKAMEVLESGKWLSEGKEGANLWPRVSAVQISGDGEPWIR